METDESASHRSLRSYATFLIVLGWVQLALFTLAGFAPWFLNAGPAVAPEAPWGQWVMNAAPAVGLLVGALSGLAFFIMSGVIRVLLDQRDLLEALVQTQRHLLQVTEPRQGGDRAGAQSPLDLIGLEDRDVPTL